MLQQTTVAAVIPFYNRWMELFPDVKTLSRAPLQKVLKAWEGLGYYQRAKNLHKAAGKIWDDYEGHIPADIEHLKALPGLGPYTTAALLSFAFDLPYPVVEANVRRVLMRVMGLRVKKVPDDKVFLTFLKPLLPRKNSSLFNQALMELGALVCKPRNPLCLPCPIIDFCKAFEAGEQEIIPPPKKRSTKKIDAVIAVIQKEEKYLIQKRPPEGLLADLWEFPGGKKKGRESYVQALHRETAEELGARIKKSRLLTKVKHFYTQFEVTLRAYECTLEKSPSLEKDKHRWVTLKGMRRYPFPSGSAKIVRFLEEKEKSQTR